MLLSDQNWSQWSSESLELSHGKLTLVQILPPSPADSDSSQGNEDMISYESHESNKHARQVQSWSDERSKLRIKNKQLVHAQAQNEKTIKSQHVRITSLSGTSTFALSARLQQAFVFTYTSERAAVDMTI